MYRYAYNVHPMSIPITCASYQRHLNAVWLRVQYFVVGFQTSVEGPYRFTTKYFTSITR